MQEPDKQIKRKHWKDERQVKWSWQSNTRGKACDTGHENNNGISSANTYVSPPNHTYEELERSISAYKKDMQYKFKAVLKTAVFANSLHQQRRSRCWFFPSHATICKDGTLFREGEVVSFPPPPLSCRYLCSWATISHHKCPRAKVSSLYSLSGLHQGTRTSCYETHPTFIVQRAR